MKSSRKLVVFAVVGGIAAASLATVLTTGDGDSRNRGSAARTIPQPPLGELNSRTRRKLAPAARRVDLVAPSFSSSSTKITNPLFPVSELHSAVLVGKLDGVPWRAETTLLPRTETIAWNGMHVQTLVSQFVAYLGGRIFEVAVDRYAQADDGSVWYLGENAFTYRHGRVADTEGTWLAGANGPPAMIMPAHPHVGDVYRTENIPGLVFEEVTVDRIGETVSGPIGPVRGAMIGRELHMDEVALEKKTFAPGHGELHSGGGGRTFEATALAVPADAVSVSTPPELQTLFSGAVASFDAARAKHWNQAAVSLKRIRSAQRAFRAGDLPKSLDLQLAHAFATLARAVHARKSQRASLAALDVASASLDLELRYRAPPEIDLARLRLWTLRLSTDAIARDRSAVTGDVATLQWIRDRIPLVRPKGAAAGVTTP